MRNILECSSAGDPHLSSKMLLLISLSLIKTSLFMTLFLYLVTKEFVDLINQENCVREVDGDLLLSDVDIIAHQVNCMCTMGAGIALQISNKYPVAASGYNNYYIGSESKGLLGQCQIVDTGVSGKYVANLF